MHPTMRARMIRRSKRPKKYHGEEAQTVTKADLAASEEVLAKIDRGEVSVEDVFVAPPKGVIAKVRP